MNSAKSMRSTSSNAARGCKAQAPARAVSPKRNEAIAQAHSVTPVEDLQLLLYAAGYYDAVADLEIEAAGRMLSSRPVSCSQPER